MDVYENIGDSSRYNFVLVTESYIEEYYYPLKPRFYDSDSDSDFDLFIGEGGRILSYMNIGTATIPDLVLTEENFADIDYDAGSCYPCLTDIDDDNKPDLFVSRLWGGVRYCHNITTGVNDNPSAIHLYTFTLYQNYPNPFNSSTTIPFTLDRAGKVELNIYNIAGQNVGAQNFVPNMWIPAGTHKVLWDVEGLASGIYIVRLQTPEFCRSQKAILVK